MSLYLSRQSENISSHSDKSQCHISAGPGAERRNITHSLTRAVGVKNPFHISIQVSIDVGAYRKSQSIKLFRPNPLSLSRYGFHSKLEAEGGLWSSSVYPSIRQTTVKTSYSFSTRTRPSPCVWMHVRRRRTKIPAQKNKMRMFDKPLGAELIGLTRFSRKYLPESLKPPLYLKKKKFEKFIFMIVQEKSVERENVLKGTPPFSFTSAPWLF